MENTNRVVCKDWEEAYNLYSDILSHRKPGYYPFIKYEDEKYVVYSKWNN